MKIVALEVSGFRGFPGAHRFDLDASAVVVVGANGQGKTTLFDAILWGLTGQIPRLGEEPQLISLYSESGEARVEVELRDQREETLRVVRSIDGAGSRLSLSHGGEDAQEEAAKARLYDLLWPNASHAQDAAASLTDAVTRSVYLQQDLVCRFVEGDSEQDRFRAISELVGAGRVTELAITLERAKTAWSRATNARAAELEESRAQLVVKEEQLRALIDAEPIDDRQLGARWDAWWRGVARHEIIPAAEVPPAGTIEGASALNTALKRLEGIRRAVERREALATELVSDLEKREVEAPLAEGDLARLGKEAEEAAQQVARARASLKEAENEAAERRRIQVQHRESEEELRTIAELALRHIDGPCPVCTQEHNLPHTRAYLERIVGSSGKSTSVDRVDDGSVVSRLAEELQQREQALTAAQSSLRAMEAEGRSQALWRAELDSRLDELGVAPREGDDYRRIVEALRSELLLERDAIDAEEAEGERLSLELAQAGEQARRRELAENIDIARTEAERLAGTVRLRQETGDLAGLILRALRDASSGVVAAQLARVDPLLQRIYATADPHPSLRRVRLLPTLARGRGRINTRLDDSIESIWTAEPEAILSSSQLNALAVSVFLALNLGVPSLPVQAAMLDDPLQSLDDINLLGLIDLLRRTKDRRQLIVSTHDRRFGRLLARKLRPVREGQRTCTIELGGWGRGGPTVHQWESPEDREGLRIAA